MSAGEFLQFPSPTKLQNIGGPKSEAILQHLGVRTFLFIYISNWDSVLIDVSVKILDNLFHVNRSP